MDTPAQTASRAPTPIRAVSRAMHVLQAINRLKTPTLMEIARATDLPYPTVFRLVHTLMHEGLVEAENGRKRYSVTSLTQTLSHGFQEEDSLAQIARPHMMQLTEAYSWPVSLAVRVGNRMMVKESTHLKSSMTFSNYYPGYTLPLLECAAGKAYLAWLPEEELNIVLNGIRELYTIGLHESMEVIDARYLRSIREKGYAVQSRNQYTLDPGKTSSLAVPVICNGEVIASLVLIYFASSLSVTDALAQYLDGLKIAAQRISDDLRDGRGNDQAKDRARIAS